MAWAYGRTWWRHWKYSRPEFSRGKYCQEQTIATDKDDQIGSNWFTLWILKSLGQRVIDIDSFLRVAKTIVCFRPETPAWFDIELISLKVTNVKLNESELSAAPIPLIETASIPLPIQNSSQIIDDLNVGAFTLDSLHIFTTNSPEDSSADDSVVIMNNFAPVILTPTYYLLFYCQAWINCFY